jgi:competence/damage-inducible protein CinA-like protein
MPSAEIIAIGTELLLGEIQDTNTQFIARALRESGINIFRTSMVGDNIERIATVVREAMGRAEIIITTGGLGPTIDDPTRTALALVSDSPLEFHPELWEIISQRFQKTSRTPGENQKRQAYIPRNAIVIENPVGTAPAFIIITEKNVIISLPGVPSEMKLLLGKFVLPFLNNHYSLEETISVKVLHTSGAGEGWIDEKIGDLETLSNPTVGLSAHSGIVDIRITARSKTKIEASNQINSMENEIRGRLGNYIFGSDADSLDRIVLQSIYLCGWTISCIESGTFGLLDQRLSSVQSSSYLGGKQPVPEQLISLDFLKNSKSIQNNEVILGLTVILEGSLIRINMAIISPSKDLEQQVIFTGSPENAPELGVNLILDRIRRIADEFKHQQIDSRT